MVEKKIQSGPVSSDRTSGEGSGVTSAGAPKKAKATDSKQAHKSRGPEKVADSVTDTADVKGAASMVDDKALEFQGGDLVAVPKEPVTGDILKMDRTDVGDLDIERLEGAAKERQEHADQIRDLQKGPEIDSLVVEKSDPGDYQSVVETEHVPLDDRSVPHRASIDDPLRDLNNNLIDINNDRLEGYHKIDGDKLLHDRGQLTQQDALEVRNVLANPNEPDAEPEIVPEPEPIPVVRREAVADSVTDQLSAELSHLATKLGNARTELAEKDRALNELRLLLEQRSKGSTG